MILISWNCRGLGNIDTQSEVMRLASSSKCDVLFLCETRLTILPEVFLQRLQRLFSSHFFYPSDGKSGGMLLLWNEQVNITVIQYEKIQILTEFYDNKLRKGYHILFSYWNLGKHKRLNHIRLLPSLLNNYRKLIIVGDLNLTLDSKEKKGGSIDFNYQTNLREVWMDLNLIDVPFTGSNYTWSNMRIGSQKILEKLDRVVATPVWLEEFTEAQVNTISAVTSDHLPIVMNSNPDICNFPKPFRFKNYWIQDPEFNGIVSKGWNHFYQNRPSWIFVRKMINTKTNLQQWHKTKYAIWEQKSCNYDSQCFNYFNGQKNNDNITYAQQEHASFLQFNEIYWKQKSRDDHILVGDSNSRYFFHKALRKRKRCNINSIVNQTGETILGDENIAQVFSNEWAEVLTSSPLKLRDCDLDIPIESVISTVDNNMLTAIPTETEVELVIRSLKNWKASGSDGFPSEFYKQSWPIIKNDVLAAITEFFTTGRILRQYNHTILFPIPKSKGSGRVQDFRPISICTTYYKIIAKILTLRLKKVITKCVYGNQAAFISGKHIGDNTILAHECVQYLKKSSSLNKWLAMKLDMSKAYDRVNWSFLLHFMRKLGFSKHWCDIIYNCISSVSYSVMVNGHTFGRFLPKNGLRQGDPLSPFLFILVMDGLSRSIDRAVAEHKVSPLILNKRCPNISHLFFADDLLIFCKADRQNLISIMEIIENFCGLSGQQINYNKSACLFSENVSPTLTSELQALLGMSQLKNGDKYLGTPLWSGRKYSKYFQSLLDKIQHKIQSWESSFLSRAGRTCLIKSVTSAMSNFAMSSFRIPTKIIHNIERAQARFWWKPKNHSNTRFLSITKWSDLCTPKKQGGLGIRRLMEVNVSFLSKLSFRIISQPTSFLSRVLASRYDKGKGWWNSLKIPPTNRSMLTEAWKGIELGLKRLYGDVIWKIGNGNTVRLGLDPWLNCSNVRIPCLKQNYSKWASRPVSDLFHPMSTNLHLQYPDWNINLINQIFEPESVKAVLQTARPLVTSNDVCLWKGSSNGDFKLKRFYENLVNGLSPKSQIIGFDFEAWWKFKFPPRLKLLGWRIMLNNLPTTDQLIRRKINISSECVLCLHNNETAIHLFFLCPFARAIWFHCLNIRTDKIFKENNSNCANFFTALSKTQELPVFFSQPLLLYALIIIEYIWTYRNKVRFHPNLELDSVNIQGHISSILTSFEINFTPWGIKTTNKLSSYFTLRGQQKFIITDGSFDNNSQIGWAFAVIEPNMNVSYADIGSTKGISPLHAELLAVLMASKFCKASGWTNTVIFTDCYLLIQQLFMTTDNVRDSQLNYAILSIQEYVNGSIVDIQWCPRTCVQPAHKLASKARKFQINYLSDISLLGVFEPP